LKKADGDCFQMSARFNHGIFCALRFEVIFACRNLMSPVRAARDAPSLSPENRRAVQTGPNRECPEGASSITYRDGALRPLASRKRFAARPTAEFLTEPHGVASIKCVRPILITSANSFAFPSSALCSFSSAGTRRCFTEEFFRGTLVVRIARMGSHHCSIVPC